MLDDMERALRAAEGTRRATLEDGCGSCIASSRRRSPRRCTEIEANGTFDPHVHEALLSQPSDAEDGAIEVLRRAIASVTACCDLREW